VRDHEKGRNAFLGRYHDFNKDEKLLSTVILAAITAFPLQAIAASQANCGLVHVPRQAAVTETDGKFFFVSPRSMPKLYDGRQTAWNEHGEAIFLLKFENGTLIHYVKKRSNDDVNPVMCDFYNQSLARTSSPACPTYDSVKNGFRTIDARHEPPVPPNRDARR
jgi:hypothetical protein